MPAFWRRLVRPSIPREQIGPSAPRNRETRARGGAVGGASGATVAAASVVRATGPAITRLQTADKMQTERAARITTAATGLGLLMYIPLAIQAQRTPDLECRQATPPGALR